MSTRRALLLCSAAALCAACASDVSSSLEALGGDDAYEENDTRSQAKDLGEASTWPASSSGNELDVSPLISRPGDPDFFKFQLAVAARVTFTISPTAPIDVTITQVVVPTGGIGLPLRTVIYSGTIAFPLSLDPAMANDPRKLDAATYEIEVTSAQDGPVGYSIYLRHVPDEDDDGAPDPLDNCDDLFNPDQEDHDDDGIGNACDTDCAVVCDDPSADGPCQGLVRLGDGSTTIFYRTHRLMVPNECITRAIFYVHGSSRSVRSGYDSLIDTAEANGALPSTLIAAPWFQTPADCNPVTGACNETDRIYWDTNGWSRGDDGIVVNPAWPPRLHSSYEIMDAMIDIVSTPGVFPNLREIIVTGHSAGGQYAQRYAAGGLAPNSVPADIDVRFLPANPSSYMLLHGSGITPLPGWTASDYIDAFTYKYGLFNRNRYMELLTSSSSSDRLQNPLIAQYLGRDVTYLIGSEDYCGCNCFDAANQPCDGSISDGSCVCNDAVGGTCNFGNGNLACDDESLAQGATRLDRAYNYIDHLDDNYTPHPHTLVEVPGVGHSSSDVYSCAPVPELLFGGLAVEGPDC